MATYNTTHQYQPLRPPASLGAEGKKFVAQLQDIFDDIYSWRNRLTLKDFKGNSLTVTDKDNSALRFIFGDNPLTGEFGLWATTDGGLTYKNLANYYGLNGETIIPGSTETTTDSYTSLLLHFFGENNSTNFINSSSYPQNITANGNAKISTAQSKFNGSSGYFDGSGSYLSIPDNDIYNFGAGDFTIDCWARFNNLSGNAMPIISHVHTAWIQPISYYLFVVGYDDKHVRFIYSFNGNDSYSITSSNTLSVNTWYHIAVVRNGSTITLYINGAPVGSASVGTSAIYNSSTVVQIGATSDAWRLNGYLDELRVSKGIARWTANFTPPTEPYAA